jgi:glycosyltransferase involved in cell wall biosynthesis
MEAMGYGLPIVTTARRGCADILTAGEHALFVPPRDPQALAGAIDRLLDDDGLRERMGRANLEKVGDFAPERVVPRYAQILRQVVREDRRRGRAGAALSQPGTGSRP